MRPFLFAACALLVVAPLRSRAQTDPNDVVDRTIEALGGEAYRQVQDIRFKGRYFQFQRGELVAAEVFTDYVRFPDRERTEFGDKGEMVRINNGAQGWNIRDKDQLEEQIPEQIDAFWESYKVGLDYLLRYTIDDDGTTLLYLGRDMIDFKRVDMVELRDDDRTRITLYIDRATSLPVKKSVRRLNSPAVEEEIYSNYHEIDGIQTPLLIDRYTDGQKMMEIRFEEVEYNRNLRDELFLPPSR